MRRPHLSACVCVLAFVVAHVSEAQLGLQPGQGPGAPPAAGTRLTFVCPASDGKTGRVYGTDVYTGESAVCAAAIHAGVLKPLQAGVVTIVMGSGANAFSGTSRNGVTTLSYGPWRYSYTFARNGELGTISWRTVWTQVPEDFFEPIPVECPAGGTIAGGIWGTDVYTRDSVICVAAVHAGVIRPDRGGPVVVRRARYSGEFPATERNGVKSQSWGPYRDAFTVSATAQAALARERPVQRGGMANATPPPPNPAITTTVLPAGVRGTPYTQSLVADGGSRAGFLWSVATGALPPGFTLASAGTPSTTLSGISTQPGTFNFSVRVTDSAGGVDDQVFTLVIAPGSTTPTVNAPAQPQPENAVGDGAIVNPTPVPTITVPTGFTARQLGNGGTGGAVSLSWQPVAGALKYRFEGPTLPTSGHFVPSSSGGVTLNSVPAGPQTWRMAAVYANDYWDPNAMATASAVVRFVPSHSQVWLTRNNGAGSANDTARHYLSLCCAIGTTFKDFLSALSISAGEFPASWWVNLGIWAQLFDGPAPPPEASYDNLTEFGGVHRATRCLPSVLNRVLCYSLSSDQAIMSVIVKSGTQNWFFVFQRTLPPQTGVYREENDPSRIFNHTLVDTVTLDSEGPKRLPHACLSCHGGNYDASTAQVLGATLLPLDPGMLGITDRSIGNAAPFLAVNKAVMSNSPSSAVDRYLRGLYGGDPRSISTVTWGHPDYVPQSWTNQTGLYKDVVRPYCIMCHLATPSTQQMFASSADFLAAGARIHAAVCTQRSMPHAESPFKDFWTKDTGVRFLPGVLAATLGFASCP